MRHHVLIALVLVVALASGHALRAQECDFSPQYYERPLYVASLDVKPVREALAARDYTRAAASARALLDVKRLARELKRGGAGRQGLVNEGEVRAALGIAIVRTAGAQGVLAAAPATPQGAGARVRAAAKRRAQQAAKNLADARLLLAADQRDSAGDPVLSTYLGEALAATGDDAGARAVLEDLAAADLIVSPEAWAVLARLRAADPALAAAARTRCVQMGGGDAVCAIPAAVARS